MGLFDFWRMGKVIAGTAKAIRDQRQTARDTQALPMETFVVECLEGLNSPKAAGWHGISRPPDGRAVALAVSKGLPEELRDFYRHCDGFQATAGDFPAAILPVAELRVGAELTPRLSARLERYWAENGNDSERDGYLAILPADSLIALLGNAAENYISPADLDAAIPLLEPDGEDFTVVLAKPIGGGLPPGTVLEIEGGMATRYSGFKHWLATRASLFSSLPKIGPSKGCAKPLA